MNIIDPQGIVTYFDNVYTIVEELNPELVEAIDNTEELVEEALTPLILANYYNGVDQFDTAQAIIDAHGDEIVNVANELSGMGIDVQTIESPEDLVNLLNDAFGEEEGENPLNIARDVLGDKD